VGTCDAGDISATGRENALRLVNLYRWLADLPAVTNADGYDDQAQACALMMDANDTLSHSPPTSWNCYTSDGAGGAGSSNISSTPGVQGVDLYMVDPGNPTTIGHRRWILSNSLGPIGLGSTSSYSCMKVIGGSGSAGAQWTAWPPPGVVPLEAFSPSTVYWTSLNDTGWTIQSDSIPLSAASVTITSGGADKPVAVTNLGSGYGSSYAISLVPQGWSAQADTEYLVEVTGTSPAFSYSVFVADCP
jgi:hypothetical protein